MLSRRDFLKGTAALSAASAALAVAGCSQSGEPVPVSEAVQASANASSDTFETLEVGSDSLSSLTDDFEQVDGGTLHTPGRTYTLALGSQVFMATDTLGVILACGETSSPLSIIELIDISTGTVTVLRDRPVSFDEGYDIYDVRASDNAIAWSECNFLTSAWRLYAATFDMNHSTNQVYLLDEGDANWDPPQFAIQGTTVFWNMLPTQSGAYTSGPSYIKMADAAASEVTDIYVSNGRVATAPEITEGMLTITPRHDTNGVYYDAIALSVDGLEVVDQLTFPKSVRPMNVIYEQGAFSFSIEATYDSSSAITSMGTYRDLGDGAWLRVPRTPSCTPAFSNGRMLVKYGKGTAVINLDDRTWYQIPAPAYSWDYGDYLAVSGTCDKLVTFATVDRDSDWNTAYVQLSTFTV